MAVGKLQLQQTTFVLFPKGDKANQTNKKNPTESWVPKTSPITVSLPEKQQPRKGFAETQGWKAPEEAREEARLKGS